MVVVVVVVLPEPPQAVAPATKSTASTPAATVRTGGPEPPPETFLMASPLSADRPLGLPPGPHRRGRATGPSRGAEPSPARYRVVEPRVGRGADAYASELTGQSYPRLQVVTVGDLMAGRRPRMPTAILPYLKTKPRDPDQLTLGGA